MQTWWALSIRTKLQTLADRICNFTVKITAVERPATMLADRICNFTVKMIRVELNIEEKGNEGLETQKKKKLENCRKKGKFMQIWWALRIRERRLYKRSV